MLMPQSEKNILGQDPQQQTDIGTCRNVGKLHLLMGLIWVSRDIMMGGDEFAPQNIM